MNGTDQRGIIFVGLLRIILVLAILGLIVVETSTVIFARIQVQDAAETAAAVAAGNYRDRGDITEARIVAETAVADKDSRAELRAFEVRADGSVRVMVFRRANTLLIHRIGPLRGFTEARGRAVAEPPSL